MNKIILLILMQLAFSISTSHAAANFSPEEKSKAVEIEKIKAHCTEYANNMVPEISNGSQSYRLIERERHFKKCMHQYKDQLPIQKDEASPWIGIGCIAALYFLVGE